jgi:glucokinase
VSEEQLIFEPGEEYAVGIDLGGTNLKGGLVSRRGGVRSFSVTPSGTREGQRGVWTALSEMTSRLLAVAADHGLIPLGIGVATPGIIDTRFGGLTGGAENLPGWKNTPFMKLLHERFGLPVHAHNDVSATVIGEFHHGAGVGKKHVILVSFGTGVGGGIIIDGRFYGGASGYAGEVGHLVTRAFGQTCACGIRGCWETSASIGGILAAARRQLETSRGKKSLIARWLKERPADLTTRIIFEAAERRDPTALSIVDEAGCSAAVGIGSLINIFNPELVIIGGGIVAEGAVFFDAVLRHLPDWTLKDSLDAATVVPSRLGYRAGIIGAATLVFEKINRYASPGIRPRRRSSGNTSLDD